MKLSRSRRGAPTFVGIYSGCGGLDLGFIQAGFKCLGAFDLDESAVAVHRANIDSPVGRADVPQSFEQIVPLVARADVLVAGPPCQGFSTIGKRDLDDPRNSLLLSVADIAAAARPRAVVVENVVGALSKPHNIYWQQLENRLSEAGYTCRTVRCEATTFGLPQSRVRVILIASLQNEQFHIELKGTPLRSLKTVFSGVCNLPNHEPIVLKRDSEMLLIAQKIAPGQKLCNVRGGARSVHTWEIPEVFGDVSEQEQEVLETVMRLRRQQRRRKLGDADPVSAEAVSQVLGHACKRIINGLQTKGYLRQIGSLYDLTNSFNGKYRRLSWTELAPTVDTRYGQPRYFLHPDQHRGISVREAARLQGFPDSFVFSGSLQTQYRLVGNAVPPTLASAVANCVLEKGI